MRIERIVLLGLSLVLISACRHPIEIWGEGDVLSATGDRDCLLEDFQAQLSNCSENDITGGYEETYTGVPRAGFQFRRWGNYCKKALTNECSFSLSASVVDQFPNGQVSPLQAVFRPIVNTGFTSLFVGNELSDPFTAGLGGHAADTGFPDHLTTSFIAAGDLGAPQALWENEAERAVIQAVLDAGETELFGMTWAAAYPSVEGYVNWIDYALLNNPDTRFFIAVPWSADPGSFTSAQFEAEYEATEALVHDLVDQLRELYPNVDIYAVPSGRAAVELHTLYTGGSLPDASALVGPAESSVFSDASGSPGEILVDLGELLWLGSIYGVDLGAYSYEPGYITDIKMLAQAVIDEHDPQYNAPPEVDTDTDGDGIVDRLDPNPTGIPNLLVIMVDDMGFNDLAINNGNTHIDTPHLDQIAQEGMRFTRHYAAQVCSPARAAMLTGMNPERVGFLPSSRGISPQFVTLPERLRSEGYTTWHIGKWHIGDLERLAWPDEQGFDHWFGFLTQFWLSGAQEEGELLMSAPRYEDPWLMGDTEPGGFYPGHLEDILTDKAIDVLTDLTAAQEPWFLNLWYYAPHAPISPSAEFAAQYPDTDAGRYRALVAQLDHNIDRVVSHLETLGMGGDTLLVIVSDNGGTNNFVDSNAPYSGQKGSLKEGGLRTPLIIRWPDSSLNGQVFNDTISIEDLYPTVLAAMGLAAPAGLDGVDYYPAIAQGQPAPQRDLRWEHGSVSYGVLSADGRYRFWQPPTVFGIALDPLLYDLLLDPTATQTVDPIPPAVLDQMTDSYDMWFRDVHDAATTYVPDTFGGGVLSGMDFLRTPGFLDYTFGLGVPDGYTGPLVTQADTWSMERTGDTVTAQLGPVLLTGEITAASSCHSIVITGVFSRKLAFFAPPEHISLSLYIDGVEVDTYDMDGALAMGDPTVATVIGDPQATAHMGTFGEPVVLNVAIDADSQWAVEDFSQELCAQP